jgi:hypothetical protein
MNTETERQNATGSVPVTGDIRPSLAAHDLPVRGRLLVMGLNYIPLLHAITLAVVILDPWADLRWRVLAALGVLYLLPAAAARTLLMLFPIRSKVLTLGSADFFKWWALLNMQMIFCRLPMLEEAMRIIPALYSAWLRLWGSKVGRLVFWSPGTQVFDRSFLEVGDDVVFGVAVQLIPHLMVRNEAGANEVLLATVKVGSRAVVGGYSLLGPGSEVAPGEATSARLLLHPFTKWRDGRRVKE